MWKWSAGVIAAALLWVSIAAGLAYRRDMQRAYERLHGRSEVMASRYGDIEWREGGKGSGGESTPAVLVIHGSGGGWDQGELVARAVLGDGWRWIAPSRFGYLRSSFRPGATFDEQAHAYALLLDHLGIERVAVVTLSHGGPSGLLFAALHPQRVSSLTLISSGVASSASAGQQQASRQGDALMWIFQQDWCYWAITQLLRKQFLELMGVSDAVIATLTPTQRALADEVIDLMNPVSLRAAGTRLDNQAKMPNERIAAIRAPTLILHAKDDTLQLFHNAEFAARHIPQARLVAFERGGHLLLAVEQATLRTLTAQHIRAHTPANIGTNMGAAPLTPERRAKSQGPVLHSAQTVPLNPPPQQ